MANHNLPYFISVSGSYIRNLHGPGSGACFVKSVRIESHGIA